METAAAAATAATALGNALKRSRKLNSATTTTTNNNNSNRKNSHSHMLLLTPPPGEEEDGEDGDGEDQVMVTDRQETEDALVVRRSSLASSSSSSWQQYCYNGSTMTSTSSRIFRVSRASGGKDRHSKVLTAKGLRDRRVRLSVATAIQFYDLQDRLGLDQPSKAVDWLIKAAADAIAELPSLEGAFPNSLLLTPSSATTVNYKDDVPPVEDPEPETAAAGKPPSAAAQSAACSSTSETSKGYILSLSRSKIRLKARERARERAAKDKDKDKDKSMADGSITAAATADHIDAGVSVQHESSSSFTELLMDGSFRRKTRKVAEPKKEETHSPWSMHPGTLLPDFFASAGIFPPIIAHGQSTTSGDAPPPSETSSLSGISQASLFTSNCNPVIVDNHHHVELHPFSFFQDHVPDSNSYGLINISVPGSCGSFSASVAAAANNNRGTLQSNSSSATLLQSHHHFQKVLSSSVSSLPTNEASVLPFFIGSMPSSTNSAENQFAVAELDARLQFSYCTAAGVQQEQQERCGRNYLSDANKSKGKN